MLWEATFAHFYSKELPEMPILIFFFTIINICFDFPHIHCATVTGNSFVDHQCRFDRIFIVLIHKSYQQNVFF